MIPEVKLEWTGICRHENHCKCNDWLLHTVPNYRVYVQAFTWLREERGYKLIRTEGEGFDDGAGNRIYTGRYTFKFLCKQEYNWFVLRWSA